MEQRKARPLAVVMGSASAAALLLATLGALEGKRNVPYLDQGGVPTVCYGDTRDVQMDRRSSDLECEQRLGEQAAEHVEDVLKVTPGLRAKPGVLVAAGSLTYNIGAAAYRRSSVARYFNRGQWVAGCNAFMAWDRVKFARPQPGGSCRAVAGGRFSCVVRGLHRRRDIERSICLRGVNP